MTYPSPTCEITDSTAEPSSRYDIPFCLYSGDWKSGLKLARRLRSDKLCGITIRFGEIDSNFSYSSSPSLSQLNLMSSVCHFNPSGRFPSNHSSSVSRSLRNSTDPFRLLAPEAVPEDEETVAAPSPDSSRHEGTTSQSASSAAAHSTTLPFTPLCHKAAVLSFAAIPTDFALEMQAERPSCVFIMETYSMTFSFIPMLLFSSCPVSFHFARIGLVLVPCRPHGGRTRIEGIRKPLFMSRMRS